jgi:RecG-like helicase
MSLRRQLARRARARLGCTGIRRKDGIKTLLQGGQVRRTVSTIVIEVGIGVPSAAVIVIEHAERLRLA